MLSACGTIMHKLKIIIVFFLLATVQTSTGQTVNPGPKKKTAKLIKAHRATLVLTIHDTVDRKAQSLYQNLPKLGTVVTSLPARSTVVVRDSSRYYYKGGVYYLQGPKGFQVILPPVGCRIQGLPLGYRRVPVGENIYFYYFGTFYKQSANSDNYDIVKAPEGAIVDALPDGYKIQKIDNVEYYLLGDTYYAEIDAPDMNRNIGYEVVTIIQSY